MPSFSLQTPTTGLRPQIMGILSVCVYLNFHLIILVTYVMSNVTVRPTLYRDLLTFSGENIV